MVPSQLIQCPKWAPSLWKAWTQNHGVHGMNTRNNGMITCPRKKCTMSCAKEFPVLFLTTCLRDMDPTAGRTWHVTNK